LEEDDGITCPRYAWLWNQSCYACRSPVQCHVVKVRTICFETRTNCFKSFLAAKPEDWPSQCEVVGTFVINQKKDFDPSPFKDLQEWIDAGEKPVFIGFGSMVIEDPGQLTEIIKAAAHKAKMRIVVQSSWTKLDVEDGSEYLRNVGPCPHDWLLPLCRAVVHHGGAGTVAAGLRFGLPTLVCPFFADQFMWGFFVEEAGVGPKACPVNQLTTDILVQKLSELSSSDIQEIAKKLSVKMAEEDGIEMGLYHFLENLPRENMLCDVSWLLGETVKSRYDLMGTHLTKHCIKVSSEVAGLLEIERNISWKSFFYYFPFCVRSGDRYWFANGLRRHAVASYCLRGYVKTLWYGVVSGCIGAANSVTRACLQFYFVPDDFARLGGAFGCLWGLLIAVFYFLWHLLMSFAILFDRILLGITNGVFGKQYGYILHRGLEARVFETPLIESEKETVRTNGVPKARKQELLGALDMVVNARKVFEWAKPHTTPEQRHFAVVNVEELMKQVQSTEGREEMGLMTPELKVVLSRLEEFHFLPNFQSRRYTLFPRLKMLRSEFVSLGTITEEKGSSDLGSGEAASNELHKHNAAERMRRAMSILLKGPKRVEHAEISFSNFLYCLQPVAEKRHHHESRRDSVMLDANNLQSSVRESLRDLSAYLH